jgi:hypothetical protein
VASEKFADLGRIEYCKNDGGTFVGLNPDSGARSFLKIFGREWLEENGNEIN